MNIKGNKLNFQNLSFAGHKKVIDKKGYNIHNFYYIFDSNKYDCELELYNIERDRRGDLKIKGSKAGSVPMNDGKVSVDFSSPEFVNINQDLGFAYRFKLTDKKSPDKKVSYAYDNGTVIGIFDKENTSNKYNVILNNRASIEKNGPMQLIMPDLYYPGIENVDGKPTLSQTLREQVLYNVRTHANKLGGNLYGIMERLDSPEIKDNLTGVIKKLPSLQAEGVKRIVGTPFTKDTISSHLYWTENAYQIAPTLGNEEDFKKLQIELFKNGISWVADAALVNEGFGGIHMSEFLRKGNDSFSKNMFRASDGIGLGIIPSKTEHTKIKIINAPFSVSKNGKVNLKNPGYNPKKPTYIQFYDDRLATKEQIESDSVMDLTTYGNKNTDNIYDITKHDDAVYPFPIEVSPQELVMNLKRTMTKEGTVNLGDVNVIKQLANFKNFSVVTKEEAKNLEFWDGNVDIAKLNFYRSVKDDSKFYNTPSSQTDFEKGALAVREYALNMGKYWTQLTSDTLLKYISESVADSHAGKSDTSDSYLQAINSLKSSKSLPKDVLSNIDTEVIQNVLDGDYSLKRLYDDDMRNDINPQTDAIYNSDEDINLNDYTLSDYILKKSMDVPLETLPVAVNMLGVLTSPYIAKKPNTENELGVSRFDLYKAHNPNLPRKYSVVYNQAEKFYANKIVPFIQEVVQGIDGIIEEGSIINSDGSITAKGTKVSEYGKYVLSEIIPDLTRYAFVKALNPKADVKINDNGEFDFTKVNADDITIQSLGIPFDADNFSPEKEAATVVSALNKGIENAYENIGSLSEKISKRFEKRSLNDFKMAEMIIDRTESGLGWRIDALKDIAAIEAVRSNGDSMTQAWNNVTDFWGKFNQAVLAINPHSYTTAEITDLSELFQNENNKIFSSDGDAERKFIESTGITTVANYNYFFSLLPEMFARASFETGNKNWMSEKQENHELRNKLDQGWLEETYNNPGFLFQSPDDGVINSYTFIGNHDKPRVLHCLGLDMNLFHSDFSSDEHKLRAAKCLRKNINEIDFSQVKSMAVAMGERLNNAFDSVIDSNPDIDNKEQLKESVSKAISELASGTFKGKKFDASAFGTRPFEIAIRSVIEQMDENVKNNIDNAKSFKNKSEIEAKVLESILTPAYDRFYSMYKLLTVLPGSPTDFAGDRVGASGYESKAKNYHQQNRNVIHWEWLNDDKYGFIKNFYDNMNKISELRNEEINPKLSALNDGATVSIPVEKNPKDLSCNVQAFLRYNDNDSVVLILNNLSGANAPYDKPMTRKADEYMLDKVQFAVDSCNAKQGLHHGLKEGTKFINQNNPEIKYIVVKEGDKYSLKREDGSPIQILPSDYNTLILYKE